VRRWGSKLILLGLLLLATGAVAWTMGARRLPKADFTFVNGTEIKSVDPHAITGQPEGRIVHAIYEGLCNWDPETLVPIPGVAERWEISSDGRVYTFHLREAARWSDDSPVTAADFVYSFRRLLDPKTAAEYSSQLWYLKQGRRYTQGDGQLVAGDLVEIEMHDRPKDALPFARGRLVYAKLKEIVPEAKPASAPEKSEAAESKATTSADEKPVESKKPLTLPGRVFVVDIDGKVHRYRETASAGLPVLPEEKACERMLLDFRTVGVEAIDPRTLRVTLENPTPYFLTLTGFYPLFPVHQKCLEEYGEPNWTRPNNLETNGPYRLTFRRVRDLIRLEKSETYWNRANVKLRTIDALAIESQTTALSLYMTGEVDWLPGVPPTVIATLMKQKGDDLRMGDAFLTSFFRCNTAKKPLDDARVRQALAMAMDRDEIIRTITQAGEMPAYSLVPPGVKDYPPQATFKFDLEAARKLLAEAGYPGGKGFPRIGILYNESEGNAAIAQLLQAQWRQNLGIDVSLQQEEWSSFLARSRRGDYTIVRGGWIGDYRDPNTFLELFLTGSPNNQTGWGNARYDELLAAAEHEPDQAKRCQYFREAEQILGREMPILPVNFAISKNLVKPYVKGFYPNAMDVHPLEALSIDYALKAKLEQVEQAELAAPGKESP
jgi:oligopeptide transport system substrate-binding protein